MNPKPVQERVPVLHGATTPAGARRAGRIAEDLARLEPAGVDEVLSSSIAARDLETEVGLLAELRAAVVATA